MAPCWNCSTTLWARAFRAPPARWALDAPVQVANYPVGSGVAGYSGSVTMDTLFVHSASPAVCGGTYAGPLEMGGPAVHLAFQT